MIDAGEDGGHPYIVFEYVKGETLKQRIARVGALDTQEAIAYAIEIARGLSVAHARNMVHRDIKPQNVLIDDEGRAKLTDFGISRQLEQAGVTATGRVLGTTDYVAPEQAMGKGADPRSDIYSLGVVLYEMLVGQVPFHADSQVGVAMKHVNEELPDVQRRRPEVSAAVALVVERATAKSPAERYQTIAEMIDDLETALEVEAARAGSTTGEATSVLDAVPPPKRKLSGRGRWSWAAIVAPAPGRRRRAARRAADLQRDRRRRRQRRARAATSRSPRRPTTTRRATAKRSAARSNSPPTAIRPAPPGKPSTTTPTPSKAPRPAPTPASASTSPPPRRRSPAKMIVRTPTPGWDAEVFAAPAGPPSDLSGWGEPVGEASEAGETQEIDLSVTQPSTYFLLWFTKASEARDQEGRYQVEISDIKLSGLKADRPLQLGCEV